jgi:hypothetical protein
MEGLLKDSLKQIPRYLSDYYETLSAPVAMSDRQRSLSESAFGAALLFAGLSLLMTLLIRLPLIGRERATVLNLASYGVWMVSTLFVMTAIIRLAWGLVGCTVPFPRYLLLNCYYFGTFMVTGHLASVISYLLGQSTGSFGVSVIVAGVLFIPIAYWCFRAWKGYQNLNGASIVRALISLGITLVLTVPAALMLGILQAALLGVDRPAFYPLFPIHPPWR